jgi:hypothetical protein
VIDIKQTLELLGIDDASDPCRMFSPPSFHRSPLVMYVSGEAYELQSQFPNSGGTRSHIPATLIYSVFYRPEQRSHGNTSYHLPTWTLAGVGFGF